jgi:ankyrin repeat protein
MTCRFGWVSCQLHYLCELSSDTARRKALNDLPRDLTDTYGRVLMRIKKHDIPLARAALQWIAYQSPVHHVDEICDIVSFMTGDDTVRYDVEDILDLCGSLVRRRENCFELAHFTVLEFLEAIKPEDARLAVFRLHVEDKLGLAKSCIQYLCSPAFSSPPPADEFAMEAVNKEHHFRMLATVCLRRYTYNWLHDPELIEILKKLFEPRKNFNLVNFMLALLWEGTREFKDVRAQVCAPEFRPLHAAALLQLSPICEWLLEQGCDVNLESPLGTPLVCSIFAYFRVKDYDGAYGSGGIQHPTSNIQHHQHHMAHLYFETTYSTAKVLLKAGAVCNVRGSRHIDERSGLRMRLKDASVGYVALQGPIHSTSPIAALLEHGLVLDQDAREILFDSQPNMIASFLSLLGPLETPAITPGIYKQLLQLAKPTERTKVSDLDRTSEMTQEFFVDVMAQALEFDDLELFRYLADQPGFETYLDQYMEKRYRRSDTKTTERHDLLCLVAYKESWKMLEALLDMDFSLDLTDFSGAWVLRECVDNGCEKEDLLRRLMTQNAMGPLSYGESMCHYLAAKGDLRTLELMLQMYGKELPGLCAEHEGFQPVVIAIDAKSSDCALLLLRSMPPGSLRLDDWKILHFTVANGLDDVLDRLIELGVNPRALDSKERSALYAVTRHTSEAIVHTLLRQGLDPDHRDSSGMTATLHYLASHEESPSAGTDFKVWNQSGVTLDVFKAITTSKSVSSFTVGSKGTAWHHFCVGRLPQLLSELSWCSPKNELDIAEFILNDSTCAIYEQRSNRSGLGLLVETCLNFEPACSHDRAARHISSLLQRTIASVDITIPFIQDSQAIRLLIWSVEKGDTKLLTVLLELGIDVNVCSPYYKGQSAIDISCLSKVQPEIFRLLLSKVDVKQLTAPNSTGSPKFHQFCVHPNRNQQNTLAPARKYENYGNYQPNESPTEVDIALDKLKAALEAGANPNAASNNIHRYRAIHVAAGSGFLDALVVLLRSGADLELLDGLGWGIVSHATWSGDVNLLSFVHERCPSSVLWNTKHSLFAILDGSRQRREYLDCCVLHVAAIMGSRPMLQKLEHLGFTKDLNVKSKDGLTPLHLAVASARTEALRWLIDRSVDLNATYGPRNRTALHIAMEMGLAESAVALIQAGAKFNPDSGGVTPEMLIHPTQDEAFRARLRNCGANLPDRVKRNLQSGQPLYSLFHYIVTGNTDQGKLLLSGYALHEFSRPLRECGGCLPITLALAYRRYAIVDVLLQKKVSTGGNTCPRLPARARGLNTTLNLAVSDSNNNPRLYSILERHSEPGTHWLLWGIQPLHVAAALNPTSIDVLIRHVKALQNTYRSVKSGES